MLVGSAAREIAFPSSPSSIAVCHVAHASVLMCFCNVILPVIFTYPTQVLPLASIDKEVPVLALADKVAKVPLEVNVLALFLLPI